MATAAKRPEPGIAIYAEMRDRVALVTGGSSGIGLATARAFARQGTRVVVASRAEAGARTALKLLSKDGNVIWQHADTSDGKSVGQLMDAIGNTHGRWQTRRHLRGFRPGVPGTPALRRVLSASRRACVHWSSAIGQLLERGACRYSAPGPPMKPLAATWSLS
jgi:NAD(P)-dependent dehydrogenase (short-subunit alcohol dehydrogenase family)